VPVENTVTVVHVVLLAAAFIVLLVNPFSLLLLLPAAILWPLARRGPWPVSRAPAWAGLIGLVIALFYFGPQLDLGADVWWYFFLLIEDRTVPAAAALIGAAVIAGALHLGHHLHESGRGRSVVAGPPERGRRLSETPTSGNVPVPADSAGAHPAGAGSETAGRGDSAGRAVVRRLSERTGSEGRLSSRPGRASGR
jgi:hypothetical protein